MTYPDEAFTADDVADLDEDAMTERAVAALERIAGALERIGGIGQLTAAVPPPPPPGRGPVPGPPGGVPWQVPSQAADLPAQAAAMAGWACPLHGTQAKYVPPGIARSGPRIGQPYPGFWVCSTPRCNQKPPGQS